MTVGKKELRDIKLDIKLVLAGLWIVLMLLYIYCDILSFYRIGQIQEMINGKMGFLDVNQMTLILISILMIIPSIMVIASLVLNARINRMVNIIIGIIHVLIGVGNIIGETWIYYNIFGVLEIIIVGIIIYKAIKWPYQE